MTLPSQEAFFCANLCPLALQLMRDLAGRIDCNPEAFSIDDLVVPGLQVMVREQDALWHCVADGLGHSPDALSPAERYPTAAALRPALIELITHAFDGVERGSTLTMHEADVQDFGGDYAKARQRDTDTRWQEVSDAAIEFCQTALGIVDTAGFRYYLPAYMIWTLNNFMSDSNVVDFTIYSLLPRNPSRFADFTPAQAQAAACFLRFMARCTNGQVDEGQAQKALEGYWGQFCPNDPVQ